ncbi:hypothetical protein OSTOST_00980 [Ostertagia ostertagi]
MANKARPDRKQDQLTFVRGLLHCGSSPTVAAPRNIAVAAPGYTGASSMEPVWGFMQLKRSNVGHSAEQVPAPEATKLKIPRVQWPPYGFGLPPLELFEELVPQTPFSIEQYSQY